MKREPKVSLTGFAMGIADLIPGVSGGTIAFISGFYERLVAAIGSIDGTFAKMLLRGRRNRAWRKIDGRFLVSLFGGILVAVLIMAQIMTNLLETYPSLVRGFFLGIILSSSIVLCLPYRRHIIKYFVLIIVGLLAGWQLTTVTGALPGGYGSLVVAGALASIAMILPGISGSYILLILGKYEEVLSLVHTLTEQAASGHIHELLTISPLGIAWQIALFVLGVAIGLIGFAKALKLLLRQWHNQTLFFLVGLMIGALPAIWPWTSETTASEHLSIIWRMLGGVLLVAMLHLLSASKGAPQHDT